MPHRDDLAGPPPGAERRRFVRHAVGPGVSARVKTPDGSLERSELHDISRGGVGLVVPCPVQAGTQLVVEITNRAGLFTLTTAVRVVHVAKRADGRCTVGGRFVPELTAEELSALLA